MLHIQSKWMVLVGFLVYFMKVPATDGQDIKIWSKDTNFLNPRNWDDQQLPCGNDRIIFPGSEPVISFMPQYLTVAELILPVNGEVIFPRNYTLELTGGTQKGECKGKDVHFRTTVDYWFEPTNWNITSNNAFPRIPNRRNLAVPHAFQVPCPTDTVQFPSGKSFRVHLDYPMTTIAALDINDVPYTHEEFNQLLHTRTGSLLFPDNPTIHITKSSCTDESGCICGNDKPRVLPTICMFVTPLCPTLECTDAIQPVGHCCPVCGAKIIIEFGGKFNLERLLNLHDSFISKAEFNGVESFTSKTHDGYIQSVFVDGGQYKGLAGKVAQLIYNALDSDMKGARLYKIRALDISKSERWNAGVPTFDAQSEGGISSGGIAGLVIVLIVCLGLAVAFFIYKKKHVPGFNFARFDLRGDKIELELGTTPHEDLEPGDTPMASASTQEMSKGFDNPVYGTKIEEVSTTMGESAEGKNYVENPMFIIFEDIPSSKEEK